MALKQHCNRVFEGGGARDAAFRSRVAVSYVLDVGVSAEALRRAAKDMVRGAAVSLDVRRRWLKGAEKAYSTPFVDLLDKVPASKPGDPLHEELSGWRGSLTGLRSCVAEVAWDVAGGVLDQQGWVVKASQHGKESLRSLAYLAFGIYSGSTDAAMRQRERIAEVVRRDIEASPCKGYAWSRVDFEVAALRAIGDIHVYLRVLCATSLLVKAGTIASFLLASPEEKKESGVEDLFSIMGKDPLYRAMATAPVWGSFTRVLGNMFHPDSDVAKAASVEFYVQKNILKSLHQCLLDNVDRQSSESRCKDKEIERLKKENQVLRTKANKSSQVSVVEKMLPAPAKQSDDDARVMADLVRRVEELEYSLVHAKNQESDLRALLDAIIQESSSVSEDEPAQLTPEQVRDFRGVMIGGHETFIAKLRKIMPNCLFYSADHKRIDAAALRERDAVIFFTGYCNHSLVNLAMRECRVHGIPFGYSSHVNIEMFLVDVAKIMATKNARQLECDIV